MVHIGLPKGDLIDRSFDIVERWLGQKVNRRQLHFHDQNDNVHFYLLKQRDLPGFVESGILDLAITSEEWVAERDTSVHVVKALAWRSVHISVLAPSTSSLLEGKDGSLTCVTEFPLLADKYFKTHGYARYKITQVSGSTEGLVPTLFDCTIDCFETGETARLNGLVEKDVLLQARAMVISNDAKPKSEAVQKFVAGLNI